jgi:3-ketosteroid 9alpha-monooxygenase subunit B
VVDETHDTRSFSFDVPETVAELFDYKAGQFLTFEIPWGGMQLRRSYSLCSAKACEEKHKVAVKRVDDGRISNWFNDEVQVGDVLRAQPPAGRFVLNQEHADRRLVLFGGGSGITPMMSLIKTALEESERDILLVYANRDVDSIIFKDELIKLQARYPHRFQIIHHLDSEGDFMTADEVLEHTEGDRHDDYYICGPSAFMDTVESALTGHGVEREYIHIERFVSPTDPDRKEMPPDEAPADDASGGTEKIVLTLMGETHEFDHQPGETILEAAFRNGVDAEYQCEEGYCGCCMAMLKEGEVDMPLYDALTDGEVEDGWILCCQAKPKSKEVEVNYDETF